MIWCLSLPVFSINRKLLLIPLYVAICLFLYACADEDPSNLVPYITDLTIFEEEGQFVLDIEGELPFKCAIIEEINQDVDGKIIVITMKAAVPTGEECPRSLTEFQEKIELDTTGLKTGIYVIDVHNILADIEIP